MSGTLAHDLHRIDGRPYGHYRDLRGRRYALDSGDLTFEHIQGDPFAAPSRLRVDLPAALLRLPAWTRHGADARRAAADFLQRALRPALTAASGGAGSGRSGTLEIAAAGQEVLERTGVSVGADGATRVRLSAGLPAAGRRILGRVAAELLTRRLDRALRGVAERLDFDALRTHVRAVEDQVALRAQLDERGLVAFLADGSILPRRSGADPRPLGGALPLAAPASLAVVLQAPHAGTVRGLAVRAGVTLIAGGGYHGKSTLLQALALGVYDHLPGDGRERCVSAETLVSVRAEDGRAVRGACLTPFIGALPLGRDTGFFDTDDASGSTSQAAAIVEALEAGATGLLIDEDTAATNFMIRDARMRRLVPGADEPITPFIDRVRQLWQEQGVSSVLVVGGAGDYLDVADCVIRMDSYRPLDVTAQAREVAASQPLGDAAPRAPGAWPQGTPRIPLPDSLDPRRGRRPQRVRAVRTRAIEFGQEEIDVGLLYQLVDPAQCRMIGDLLLRVARGLCDGRRALPAILAALEADVEEQGLDALVGGGFGDRARPRRFEVAAALNRLRSLRVAPPGAAPPRTPARPRPSPVGAPHRRESRNRGRRQH
ncbi:MAG: ABC-ATPase domain-containing protein [Spirochaetaceae bacterium]|nr:ABC-ATPase domain-containing protein [Spirochaetaceae bacterium]